jgi:hypothetical protein
MKAGGVINGGISGVTEIGVMKSVSIANNVAQHQHFPLFGALCARVAASRRQAAAHQTATALVRRKRFIALSCASLRICARLPRISR